MKRFLSKLQAVLPALLVASPLVLADDTDIYYTSFQGNSNPLVMLTLDLRSNLSSTQCTDLVSDDCNAHLSDTLYYALDLMTYKDAAHTYGPDGVPDSENFKSGDVVDKASLRTAWTAAINKPDSSADTKVRLFDILRAAFQVIINDDKIQKSGLWLGLMIMHEHTQNCVGPASLPNNANQSGCSNGAYVLKGFFQVNDPIERADFFKRLAALPMPSNVGLPPGASGNSTWNGHSYQLKELYLEYYRYITGQNMYNGLLGYEDFNSNDDKKNLPDAGNDSPYVEDVDNYYVAPDPATYDTYSSVPTRSENYISPFETGDIDDWACSGLYIINTVFGTTNQDDDSDDMLETDFPLGLNVDRNPTQDEVIAQLYKTDILDDGIGNGIPNVEGDQNVTSFILADTTNNKQNGWADSGGTDYALSLGDGAAIKASFEAVFDSIISQSSSLVSSSVPVNVFNRAETLDSSYLAVFQAESGARWPGNIKKLQIGSFEVDNADTVDPTDTITVKQIQDANGIAAFDPLSGLISANALTFWTDPDGKDVTPDDPNDLAEDEVSGKDGNSVKRGGAAQQLYGFNTHASRCYGVGPGTANDPNEAYADCFRQLYTENPNSPGNLIAFDATDTLATSLVHEILELDSSVTATDAQIAAAATIISWSRGAIDVNSSLDTVTGQRWMMGDILHSKPLPLNYGDSDGSGGYSRDNPNIRLVFGSNDGWFRMIKNTTPGGAESGDEVWGFMPSEMLGIQESLARDIAPASGHPYGVDGEISALIIDKNSDSNIEGGNNSSRSVNGTTGEIGTGDKVFVFFGLRRGGNAYYALDVSNPDAAPELMWKITDADSDFSDLAMSFSTPLVAIVNYAGRKKPVVIFGGGYNGGWNSDETARVGKDVSGLGTSDAKGNAVYVVDALTGDLIWKAVKTGSPSDSLYAQDGLVHSIASPFAFADSDRNGITDLGYVGDTGGNVWRLDMPEYSSAIDDATDQNGDSRDRWSLTKLANLGGSMLADDRRFFQEPDIVLARDSIIVDGVAEDRDYIGVAISSGDRTHPREVAVNNFMYYLKDPLIQSGSGITRSAPIEHVASAATGLPDITSLCVSGDEALCLAEDLSGGWKLSLGATGEKGFSTPRVFFGTIYFNTYLPEGTADQGSCTIGGLGSARSYAVTLSNGSVPDSKDIDDPDEDDRFQDSSREGPPGDTESISDEDGFYIQDEPGDIDELDARVKWKVYWHERNVDGV